MKNPTRFVKALIAIVASLLLIFTYMPPVLASGYAIPNSGDTAELYTALHSPPYNLDPTNQGGITSTELASLTGTLDLSGDDLTSIEGLEYCTGVTELNLSGNSNLNNINPLDSVEDMLLETLNLDGTQVAHLPEAMELTHLESLSLSNDSAVTDANLYGISSSNLPSLETLTLKNCSGLHTINTLADNDTLVNLFLDDSPITDMPGVMSGMKNLSYLSLRDIQTLHTMTNLYQIQNLPKFHNSGNDATLDISNSDIVNVSWLNHSIVPGMTQLIWQGTTSADFTSLSGLTQLKNLDLSSNPTLSTTSALTTIASLPSLTTLSLTNCGITDLTLIGGMSTLTTLYLGSNHIHSVAPLASLTNLHSLRVNSNYISDISPLANLVNLTYMNASSNYLDPTAASPDRVVLDAMAARPATTVTYSNQYKITITYASATGTPTKATDTDVYYGHEITLPTVSGISAGHTLKGWDTDNDGVWDHAGGVKMNFTWPVLPIPGNAVTFNAYISSGITAITQTANHELYNALHATPYNLDSSNTGSITDTELESLTGELNLSSKSLTSINGLQYCTNVTTFTLNGNTGLGTISPLGGYYLPNVTTLNLENTGMAALPENLNMPNLDTIDVSGNATLDNDGLGCIIAPTSTVPKLATITARNCSDLNGIDSLDNMTTLTRLYLDGSHLSAFPADMSGMTNLAYLSLNGIPNLSSATNIHAMTSLPKFSTYDSTHPATLDISNTNVTDVSFLSSAAGLRTLNWGANPGLAATDIATLSGCTQVTLLNLNGDTGIGNSALTTIASLTNINQLFINNCGTDNLSSLQPLTGLIVLSADHNSFTNLNGIQDMSSLSQIYVSNNAKLVNISKLSGIATLTTFYATYTSVNDISVLAGKPLTDVNVACDYLDPTPGSADMTILNALMAKTPHCNVTYNDQQQITITYFTDPAVFVGAAPADATVYYGQNFALPAAQVKNGYAMTGWNTTNTSHSAPFTPDHPASAVIPFTWPTLPILAMAPINGFPGTTDNNVLFLALNTSLDATHELSGLTATAALSPVFDPLQSYYSISLPASTTSVTLTPHVTAPDSKFTISGASVPNKAVYVAPGASVTVAINVIHTISNVDDGGMQYLVVITRASAGAATIASPGYNAGALNKTFDPYITSGYTLTLPEGTGSVTFAPVKSLSSDTLYINNVKTASKKFTLATGQSTTVTVKVVSSPSSVKKSYTFTVKRDKSTNDNLSALSVSSCALAPGFNAATTSYTVNVPESKSSVTIKATKAYSNATLYINGSKTKSKKISISNGSTKTVTVKVVAQSGVVKYYTITLKRPPHINSFSATPKVSGKPTVQVNVTPAKPIKFTYSLAKNGGPGTTTTKLELYQSGVLVATLLSRVDGTGTKTYTWDGKVSGVPVAAGTYSVKLYESYTYNGVTITSAAKTLTIVVK